MAIDLTTPEPYSCPADPPATSEGYWPEDPEEPDDLTVHVPFDLRDLGRMDDALGIYHVEIMGLGFAEYLRVRRLVEEIIRERKA
jgi:hypothetical protein